MKLPRVSPIVRLSLGLTSLVVTLLLILDFAGLVPNHLRMLSEVRNRNSEALAIQTAALLQTGDAMALGRTFEEVRTRDPDILSLAVRKKDGQIYVAVGEHARYWIPPVEGRSMLDHVQIPVFSNQQPWGNVEISYTQALPTTFRGWLLYPEVLFFLVLAILTYVFFYLYMRRALQYLDPTSAVPERVRHAYDTLTDGIAIVDREQRIMLTNKAFQVLHPAASGNLTGKKITEQAWLCECLDAGNGGFPWEKALRDNEVQSDVTCNVRQPSGSLLNVILHASPLLDPKGTARGCLISFDNVTQLHRINDELRGTLAELEASREKINQQNQELEKLASRDPLTGCLNRRSFFAQLDELFISTREQGKNLCCLMADIDHFKLFNDRYGHAVGDEVIRALVRTLQAGLRIDDLLCRYGGEEFCIVFPDTNVAQALEVAARLRSAVEQHAGSSVRTTEGIKITSSFGLAALEPEIRNPADLIDRADKALYQSKEAGRNRVTLWQHEAHG